MDKLIYTAMTGARQTLDQQGAVAHNLANASSTAYKAEEHKLRAVQLQNGSDSAALPTRAFVVDASIGSNFASGPLMQTNRSLDVALQGQGWLAVQMPDGSEAYTRNGSLQTDTNGVLQTRDGWPVAGLSGVITLPPDNRFTFGADGTITALPESGAQNTANAIGQMKLVNPPEADLVRGADGLFRLKDGSQADADPNVQIAGGFLEGSNVNVVEQMVSMISLARQFELQTKMMSTAQSDDQSATQLLAYK